MYVLTDKATGGVYAVTDDEKDEKVVQIFVDKDDALRYYGFRLCTSFANSRIRRSAN